MSSISSTRFPLICVAALVFLFVITGCSGSGGGPVTPDAYDSDSGITTQSPGDAQAASSTPGCRLVWACYDVSVDPDSGVFDIVPLRHPAFTFNVTMFLQPPAGNPANLGLSVVDASQFQSTGRIDLDISFTHPFPALTKLRGFDVMGVFMGNGTVTGYLDPSVIYPASDGSEARLINADGYTRWMNATEFTQSGLLGFTPGSKGIPGFVPTSTINGFKYYTENLGATQDVSVFFQNPANVAGRGSFEAGSTLTRRYEIRFPMSGGKPFVRFQYAILASWAKPDPASLPDPDIDDHPPSANLQEPMPGAVTTAGTDLFFINSTDFGGTLKLRIEVFDWQGAANPLGVPGELAHIWIEDAAGAVIPGGAYDILSMATVSAGSGNSSVFNADIVGCSPQSPGPQEFLIMTESASPTNYDNGFGSPYPTSAALAGFRRVTANVLNYNPCPTPTVTAPSGVIVNVNDIVASMSIVGTDLQAGPQLSAELRGAVGGVPGTNVQVTSSTTAVADFDFTSVSAGMYDFHFRTGCGIDATPITGAVEVNTPPTSTGITGPSAGDANTGVANYNSNAVDTDTDPVDPLTYAWNLVDTISMQHIIGPVPGDPFPVDFATLSVSQYDVSCLVSDGYPPADLYIHMAFNRDNTQPKILTPNGWPQVWLTDILTYQVVASDQDPGQTLTYVWSLVPMGNPVNYVLPGDPIPGDITIDFSVSATSAGFWDLSCRVDDGSGALNATADSPRLSIYVANPPYTDPPPISMFNQIIIPGAPSSQGVAGCPSFWDTFYAPLGTGPYSHPDISILSGPSLGMPGVMVIADEMGAIVPAIPISAMGWAHFTCPFVSGAMPSFTWTTTAVFPGGPDMIPSAIHFDGNSMGEIFITNSQMTGKLAAWLVPDPSAFQHFIVGNVLLNDLFTSLPAALTPDVAVDSSAGFDMGTPITPMNAPLYSLYTQDQSGILASCGGPAPGLLAPFPVHILQFPASGAQPPGTPVDLPGSVGVVAPLPAGLTGIGPGLFGIFPGGPSPSGGLVFPEPYFAIGVDDDPADNLFPTGLPLPVGQWVIIATIDADRDVEIYEVDFGVPPPGPAPIVLLNAIPYGSFLGGLPNVYPLDLEFISNFTGFGGTPKPIWQEDLLAVLLTESVGGFVIAEIYSLAGGTPTPIASTLPIPTPPTILGVPGIGYRLDVDELTGDLYILHEDTVGSASMTVTIIPY